MTASNLTRAQVEMYRQITSIAADQLAVLLQSLPAIVRKASWSPPIDIFAAEVTNQVGGAGGLVAILFAGQFEIDFVQNEMAIAGEATLCCRS
jgi:hypothetical protein